MAKLKPEHLVTLKDLSEQGASNSQLARVFGVTEGAVRYQRSKPTDRVDGRASRASSLDGLAKSILDWIADYELRQSKLPEASRRPVNIRHLYEWLTVEHGFKGHYKSVLRFVRRTLPKPPIRTFRRVELPPASQGQVDWAEFPRVKLGVVTAKLYLLLVTLAYSRYTVAVWSQRMDQLSWLHCHNEALLRLEGVPATLRIDNLKTGVSSGSGPWGKINPIYKRYSELLGFHVDPCLVSSPHHKGKVERQVFLERELLDIENCGFSSLEQLQAFTDKCGESAAKRKRCPSHGGTVWEAFVDKERALLRPLPEIPEPFDISYSTRVSRDCLVRFEERQYSVPFQFVGQLVTIQGGVNWVRIYKDTRLLCEHERGTERRLVIDPSHFEGEASNKVAPPTPLGRVGRTILELAKELPEPRAIDYYSRIAEARK